MASNNEYIISGPKVDFKIQFESYGEHLFNCLKRRKSDEVLAIDPFTKRNLTCGEVLEKSIKLSLALQQLSLKRGDIIGIISENILECYVALCGSLFSGAQILLLNPAYTTGELKHVFEIAKPKMLFTSATAVQNLLSLKQELDYIEKIILMETKHVEIQTMEDLIEDVESIEHFGIVKVDARDTVFMCLSSGTTGLPKCVEWSHKNLLPFTNYSAYPDNMNITSEDTSIVVVPFFHIYGLILHLLSVTNSLTIISMRKFKPDIYLQSIDEYKATKLFLVPPMLLFLLKNPIVYKYSLATVKDIIIGAAPLGSDLYEEAVQRFSHCTIRQMYGSTEGCGLTTLQRSEDTFLSIGKVVCNTSVKIVDINTNTPLGPYEKGEICFKCDSLMKGYLNNPTETKISMDNDGFYHSGDIGYYDSDKNFFVVDRIKELIKYKGFQVAPAELENILFGHPGVKDCGVVGVADQKCGQLPLAFVVRQTGLDVTEEELVKFVADKISIQKQLHGGVHFIEQIPRTSSGKILRRELIKLVS